LNFAEERTSGIGSFLKGTAFASFVQKKVMEEERANPNFIEVCHGHLRVNVPLTAYEGSTFRMKAEEAEKLKRTLASRYPWLTDNALKVFIEEAEQTMQDRIRSKLGHMDKARIALRSGNYERARRMAERQLEGSPDDPDAWYILGESLCNLDEKEKGFAALAKARSFALRR
jgi:tetratricopeptide (TPR) repeat protein